jgi:hypothetical protein
MKEVKRNKEGMPKKPLTAYLSFANNIRNNLKRK